MISTPNLVVIRSKRLRVGGEEFQTMIEGVSLIFLRATVDYDKCSCLGLEFEMQLQRLRVFRKLQVPEV